MKTTGFTLLELLVYCFLFSFFTILVAGFGQVVFTVIKQQSTKTSNALRNAVVLDLLRRDLMSASMNKINWDTAAFVFKKELVDAHGVFSSVCVGWEGVSLKDVRMGVRRSEGIYDFALRQWKSRSLSALGAAMHDLQLSLKLSNDRQRVVHAIVQYVDDACGGVGKKEIVRLENRVLL